MSICIIGDSIVYGEGDAEQGGWANRLRLGLERIFSETKWLTVYNLGVAGDASFGSSQNSSTINFLVNANNFKVTQRDIRNVFKNSVRKINSYRICLIQTAC